MLCQAGRDTRQIADAARCAGAQVGESGCALGQRTGLVQYQHAELVRAFQSRCIFHQYSFACGKTAGDDNSNRCRQTQGTGTGDHQHRNRRDDGIGKILLDLQPDEKGNDGEHQHNGHKDAGNLVGKALDRRLRALRLFHHMHHRSQLRMAADGGCAALDHALMVKRGCIDLVVGLFCLRHAFAGEHALVQGRSTFQYHAVHRHILAGAHDENVVRTH